MSVISDLVAKARVGDGNTYEDVEFGKVSNIQGQQIKGIADGIETNLFPKKITTSGISHAIKGHGDNLQESARGQKGLVDSDFEYVPQIVNNPDSIEFAGVDKSGNQAIRYIKKMKGLTYFVVMTIKYKKDSRTKSTKGRLEFATMFIKK